MKRRLKGAGPTGSMGPTVSLDTAGFDDCRSDCRPLAEPSRRIFLGGSLLFAQAPFAFKELGEDAPANGTHHSSHDFAAMVEPFIIEKLVQRLHRAGFWVDGTEDDPRYSALKDSTSAHGAWFQRDIKRAIDEPP